MKNRETLFVIISRLVFVLSNYFVHLILGRFLSPVEYGAWGIIAFLLNLGKIVLNNGIPQAVSKTFAEKKYNSKSILFSTVFFQSSFSLILFAIVFAGANWIGGTILKDASIIPLLKTAAFILPTVALYSYILGIISGNRVYGKYSIVVTSYSTLRLGLSTLAIFIGLGISGVLKSFILVNSLSVLIGITLLIPEIKNIFNDESAEKVKFASMLTLSLPITIFIFFINSLMGMDLFFLKRFLSDGSIVGYYNISVTLSKMPYFLFSSFAITLLPNLSHLNKNKCDAEVKKTINEAFLIIFSLILPAAAIISGSAKEIVILIYTSVYSPAFKSLSLLIFAYSFFTFSNILATVFFALDDTKRPLIIIFIAFVFAITLFYFFVPRYEDVGAALTALITSILTFSYFVISLNKRIKNILCQIPFLIKSLLILATIGTVSYFVKLKGILLIVECGILYAIGILSILALKEEGRIKIKQIFKRITNIIMKVMHR